MTTENAMRAARRLATVCMAALLAAALGGHDARAGGYEDLQRCAELTEPEDADESIALCTRALQSGDLETRNRAIAFYNRANAYRRVGRYQEAAADYTDAIEIWPELDQAWNNRGGVYARLCRTEDALNDFKQAMALDPIWIRNYQEHLRNFGVDIGVVDGQYGPVTERGLTQLIEAQCE